MLWHLALSLDGAYLEQKFMLVIHEQMDACKARLSDYEARQATQSPAHAFDTHTSKQKGMYFNVTLWQDNCRPHGSATTASHQI